MHTILTVGKTNTMGNTRKTGKEQYYTKAETVEVCLQQVYDLIPTSDLIVEPCGGHGDFLEGILDHSYICTSYDIEPHHPAVEKKDWFEVDKINTKFSVITNPPFGRMNSLSVKFFNHAADLGANYIAFLIPVSWRKWSTMNRLDKRYHLVKDVDLPNDHLFYGKDVDFTKKNILKCIFQVWERSDVLRGKIEHSHSSLTKAKPSNADIQIVQQGWHCGQVNREFNKTKGVAGTCYYNADEETIKKLELMHKTDAYTTFKQNTAYVDSISYSEISFTLNKLK